MLLKEKTEKVVVVVAEGKDEPCFRMLYMKTAIIRNVNYSNFSEQLPCEYCGNVACGGIPAKYELLLFMLLVTDDVWLGANPVLQETEPVFC